ncbi:hypothetical protein D0Z00_001203 [Geotrichum galactomycetum]|uniref:Uncharacterized protein n=1 Tax=Geotrichum galactomycetum TaxID=27317 RepID=A0ACB6V7T7_9ASCO|nr:hypothetical protein D0Z00_001203 [Geotrichum candidum]
MAASDPTKDQDLICVESPKKECYPKEFQPTNEWQIVREGQSVPKGLHVRLDMQTGLQEAKLLDESDKTETEDPNNKAIEVIVDEEEGLIPLEDEPEAPEEDESDVKLKHQVKYLESSHHELSPSLETLQNYKTATAPALTSALESLADLGHELDFGALIAKQENLKPLLNIVQDASLLPSVRETAVRALGASLRNNPDALKAASTSKITTLLITTMKSILNNSNSISTDTQNNKLVGRLIYALGSTVGTGQGDETLYQGANAEYSQAEGNSVLRQAFETAGADVKRKTANFISDRILTWPIAEAQKWSNTFQNELTQNKLDESTKSVVFETLVKMHEFSLDEQEQLQGEQQVLRKRNNRNSEEELPVDDKFLNWLIKQAEDKNADEDLIKEAKRVRHDVFGNPLARRKAFEDEL